VTFAVGIDLGTTNCALSNVDPDLSEGETVAEYVAPIAQLVAPGTIEERKLLPSFLYLPHEGELAPKDLVLPWGEVDHLVGELARTRGAETPIRLVASAKSWLCHPGIDRRAAVLPLDAPPEVARVSPLDASTRYLAHLRAAWDAKNEDAPLADQDVVITVPASFDPAARELTAEAASRAGLGHVTLLEEPQAALYAWILESEGTWREQVHIGDVILVVDVGGGTTDLSLIAVLDHDGALELHRVAVGDHILLGGDNMDLALAHVLRAKLETDGRTLDSWQLQALVYAARSAKEGLLSDGTKGEWPVVVAGRGSKVVGGAIRTELTRDEVTAVLVEGFFPRVDASARPVARARAALTELGLPYAQDAAITRHLAAFLGKQAHATDDLEGFERKAAKGATFLHPTAVLFNGGVFRAAVLQERIVERLDAWLAAEGGAPIRRLAGADLDLAVARGAAYYGYVRRGKGVRIRGGTAKSFYVGVETATPAVPGMAPPVRALCVAPFGMEEGTEAGAAPQELMLVVGEPVRFRFFGSSVRRDDTVGTFVDRWTPDELAELREVEVTLPAEGRTPGDVVPVRLHAAVTEVGTLRLEAIPRTGPDRWKLELNVREA